MSSSIFYDHPLLDYVDNAVKDVPQSFNHIIWHITNRCNLECTYCYTSSSPFEEKEDENTLYKVSQVIGILQPKKLSIVGGEPLIVPNLDVYLHKVKELSPHTEIHIDTNLTLLTPDLYLKLRDAVAYWNTTVDHYIPSKHNTTRGLWQNTVENIRFLVNRGERVNAVVVVTTVNYRDLDRIVDFLLDLGVNKVILARSKPAGRGMYDVHVLRGKELYEAMRNVSNLVDNERVFSTGWFNEMVDDYYGLESCYCGIYQFTVDRRGNAFPCENMTGGDGISLPDLLSSTRSRERIIRELKERFLKWGKLTLLYPAVCIDCSINFRCRKSCRYITFEASHNPLARPFFCTMKEPTLYDIIGYNFYSPIYPEGRSRWKTFTAYILDIFIKNYGAFEEYGSGGGVWLAYAEQKHDITVKGYEINPSMIQLWELYKHKHGLKSETVNEDVRNVNPEGPVIMLDNFVTHFSKKELLALFSNIQEGLLIEFTEVTPSNREHTVKFGGIEFHERIEVIDANKVKKTVCRHGLCYTMYQYFYHRDDIKQILTDAGLHIKKELHKGRYYIIAE